jgi:hypothetical protein
LALSLEIVETAQVPSPPRPAPRTLSHGLGAPLLDSGAPPLTPPRELSKSDPAPFFWMRCRSLEKANLRGMEKGGEPDRDRSQRTPPKYKHSPDYDNRTGNQGPHSKTGIGSEALLLPGLSPLHGPGFVQGAPVPQALVSDRSGGLCSRFSLVDSAAEMLLLQTDVHGLPTLSPCATSNS